MPPDLKRLKVKHFREFDIPLAGLALGTHGFDFEIGPKFFQHFGNAQFDQGNVHVHLDLEKQENLFELHFSIKGHIEVACDRCLEPFDQVVTGNNQLLIKYGDAYHEESDEVLILSHDMHLFDVSQLVYEYISLLIPFRCVHNEGECNQEMIQKIEQHEKQNQTDPRWDVLKQLKNT